MGKVGCQSGKGELGERDDLKMPRKWNESVKGMQKTDKKRCSTKTRGQVNVGNWAFDQPSASHFSVIA